LEPGQTAQRIDELHFFLFNRALHPELFNIHRNKRVRQRRYQAEIWFTGLSHVVTFQFQEYHVTELIGMDSELMPKTGLVTEFRFRGEQDLNESFENGIGYIMSSQVERMTSNLFTATHRDLVRHAKKRGILVPFKDWVGEGLEPFSFIDYEPRDFELHINAFHAFPEDLTVLKTQSIFELDPAVLRKSEGRAQP
jgi:hypothetical protein